MARDPEYDVNDPLVYTPRESPHVQRAGNVPDPAAPRPDGQEYLFDEGETWNDPLDALPVVRARRGAAGEQAAPDAQNPYVRRRAQPARQPATPARGGTPGRVISAKGMPILYASVTTVCMLLLAFICVMMMPQLAGYFWKDFDNYAFIDGELLVYQRDLAANYKLYRDYMKQDVIFDGVFVDGVHLGGMTVKEAEAALAADTSRTSGTFSLAINIGNKSWLIDSSTIPSTRVVENVVMQAYAVGRQNTTAIIGTAMTPFRERVDTVMATRETYVNLRSDATYDHDAVRAKIDEIAAYVTRDPVNAQIESFNPNTRTFTFTDDQAGVTIDADALYQQVIAKLDQHVMGEAITVSPTITTPAVTKSDLINSFKLVAAFTTDTTRDSSRNNNINLACQAINGTVLLPGETFSFNGTTGQRTTDKGYQSAGAIAAGQSIEEVGGGICQVSSTLFNAVVRADLEIVSRSPHAWPSTYVKIGEDATVNWPNLDFKFRNNKSTPVFIIAYYKDRKCSAEVWGMTLGSGLTIDLESRIIRTMEPPTGVNYVNNPDLAPGESEETVKARTGYVVDTYKIWYRDGQEVKRELLYTSTYKAYQRTVEYN